ncbi:general stress protein [Streptomyces spongiae]|uniref:General stress protein 17M-like domain-containing protein n=1 Tax=Streptomyces spongiae TaxID=565072 RepID=A0A5N8XF85_9ACTN|nr:general stress protein [Streptomyces spongiae]MPY58037.1 hypothetical protein [Streptomyces spongiae]
MNINLNPVSVAWNTVASHDTYEAAQETVDRLSDKGFPVEHLDIVGSDLRMVERVTGRLTTGRAASAGAVSGAWFGLLIGLLVGMFTPDHAWLTVMFNSVLISTAWGALFGLGTRLFTRGRRDFSSVRTLTAARYDVVARDGYADRARETLTADAPRTW